MSERARVVAGLLCAVVLVSAVIAVVPAGAQPARTGVEDVTITGGGVIDTPETPNGSTYLWVDESINASVTVADRSAGTGNGNYGVCLQSQRPGEPSRALVDECESLALSSGTNDTVDFANVTWPANVTGRQVLVVEVRNRSIRSNTTVLDRERVPVTVLRRGGDFDRDGLTNTREVEAGYNVSNRDMDADTLLDGEEVNKYGSDPQNPDSDGDGIRDGVEIQRGTDPTRADSDGDGLSDSAELTLGTNPTSDLTPLWLAIAALVVVGLVVGGFVLLRRGWREVFARWRAADEDPDPDPPSETTEESPSEPETPTEPPEPLTDADRVLALLRSHGGRMKQTRIVEETEWSKAKVSRLLSSMNDDGSIQKLSIGRENIISLDGHGPEAAQREENASD
ncbi:helix-turn-helix transcriptional regulator [Halococcus salsus]|uniref:helix-turn-helix transcriptional regulator n=1 Tax=Halococcus salsus TaxID=2162894 RepID=UPI00135A82B2|nr:helix-turn-helix domain-containing protein [Halococcus salsus]